MRTLVSAALVMIVGLALAPALADEPQAVVVTNFPEVQKIDGAVSISGPLATASLRRQGGIVVSPVSRAAALNQSPQWTVDTDGFTSLVVSLVGEVQGQVTREGNLGVVLVPDDDLIVRALRQDGAVLFPLETKVPIPAEAPAWLGSESERFNIAFPRYRVYLYNTGDKSISASVYVYLTNS